MINSSFTRLFAAYAAQFTEDLPFWRDLAKSSGSPILELGCGTGRVLCELVRDGFLVTGLDNNEDMLQSARSKISKEFRGKMTLIQGDVRNFHLADQYPLIIVPCNTFAYFDDADAPQLLQSVKLHLTRNGKLAMVVPNPAQYDILQSDLHNYEASESEPITDFIEPISGHPVQVYAYEELDTERNILQVLWAFDELFPDGQVKRFQHSVCYHLRSLENIRQMLRDAQMNVKQVYGDYQCGPLNQNSHDMVIIAVNEDVN